MPEVRKKKSKAPIYISLAIVATVVLAYFFIPSVQSFFQEAWAVLSSGDEARIESWVSNFGWMGPVVLVLSMVIQMFLIVVPSVALIVVSVLAYGPIWGSLIVLIAVTAASSVGYAIGAYFGRYLVEKLIGKETEEKISTFIDDYGFWAVFITRLNPFLSNDAISFVAGMLRLGYWKFIRATLLGITPLTIVIAILGESNDLLQKGLLWGSVISLVIFIGFIIWRKMSKADSNEIQKGDAIKSD